MKRSVGTRKVQKILFEQHTKNKETKYYQTEIVYLCSTVDDYKQKELDQEQHLWFVVDAMRMPSVRSDPDFEKVKSATAVADDEKHSRMI